MFNRNKEFRKCSKCGLTKHISLWGKNKASSTGLQSWCMMCRQKDSEIYSKKNRKRIGEVSRKCRIKRRLQLLILLGKICINCGENRVQFLQIDHINNDGGKERKESGQRGMTTTIINEYLSGKRDIKRLQILCANCNYKKQYLSESLLKYIDEVKKEIDY